MKAYYASQLSPNMSRTPEGFLICHNVPIARTGWQEYLASELGLPPGPSDGLIRVERIPEEVFSPATLASFEGKPVVNDHPPDGVSPVDAKLYVKGSTQNVRQGTGPDADLVLADLVLYDDQLIQQVQAGKRSVSAGYECDYEGREDGTYVQRHIVGNHVAVVDHGRAGDRVRIHDDQKGPAMSCDEHKNKDGTFKGGFDGAVAYFRCRGHSEEAAKAIAGEIAKESGADSAPAKRGVDRMSTKLLSMASRKRVTDLLAAMGLKQFAQDAEPEDLQQMVDAIAGERSETPDTKTQDEPEDDRQGDAMEKKLDKLIELITQMAQGKKPDSEDTRSAEQLIDDELQQMADPEGTDPEAVVIDPQQIDDEGFGEVSKEGSRPESGLGTIDRAIRMGTLKTLKASLAAIEDPALRRKAADSALKALKTSDTKNTYAAISQATRKKAQDAAKVASQTQAVDHSQLGREWAKKFNPHYKERA